MRLTARAKINWALTVTGRTEDGYHLLDMVMQSVSLADEVTLEPAPDLTLEVRGASGVPTDERNIALRAARLLQREAGVASGARILLEKRVPVGAGMGGGSADAAAVLLGLERLWRLSLPRERMLSLALSLGADVPFCLTGGACRAGGIGEKLTPLPAARDFWLVVLKPAQGLSTREVFTRYDEQAAVRTPRTAAPETEQPAQRIAPPETEQPAQRIAAPEIEQPTQPTPRPSITSCCAALSTGDLTLLAAAMGNDLQGVSEALCPAVRDTVAALRAAGALGAMMTGSGSAAFGLFPNQETARTAARALSGKWKLCWCVHTCDAGISFLNE